MHTTPHTRSPSLCADWTGFSTTSASGYTVPAIGYSIFSGIIYFGLFFCLVAWGLGLWAGARVRSVAVLGVSAETGCCAPSMPAIQGLLWVGFLACCSGSIYLWVGTGYDLPKRAQSPGAGLMGFSVACLLLSAILYSVTGCCTLGPLPGVGTSTSNCCCVERNRSLAPPPSAGCCGSVDVHPALHAQPLAMPAALHLATPAAHYAPQQSAPKQPPIWENPFLAPHLAPPAAAAASPYNYPTLEGYNLIEGVITRAGPLGASIKPSESGEGAVVEHVNPSTIVEPAPQVGDIFATIEGTDVRLAPITLVVELLRSMPRPAAVQFLRKNVVFSV